MKNHADSLLWSVRMRASKGERHISGAEGICPASDIDKTIAKYFRRAIGHPKGKPDGIVVTVERLRERPSKISSLPVNTTAGKCCKSPGEVKPVIKELLLSAGVSDAAIRRYPEIMKESLRGAALLSAKTGRRLDPYKDRGVRVSMLGISSVALKSLKSKLARRGISTETVIEAIILASKVASSGDVVAELCISDDPHYTTGYVASEDLGYVRIPNIKKRGPVGGRVFFLKEGADRGSLIDYLQRAPVIVTKAGAVD